MTTASKQPANEPEKESTSSILSDLKGTGANESPAMPDLGGVNPSSPKSKYKVHSQTLVISLVLVASGAALYTMRKKGMEGGVNFNPPKIIYDMDKTSQGGTDVDQRRVLSDLARSQSPPNVLLDKIQKNPFQLDAASGVPQAGASLDPADAARTRDRQAAEQRETQIRTALASVEVGAIMAGNVPLARINGKIVREGEVVADIFMVKEIHDRSVDLEVDGKIHTVNMSESTGGGGPKPRPPMAPRR